MEDDDPIHAGVRRRRSVLADQSTAPASARRGGAPADPRRPLWGLALSGGGIRSATFCLGLLRALAARGLLARIDLISSVSGGGYIAATFGRLFSGPDGPRQAGEVNVALADANSRWFMWWLRANGRYLVPRGARDYAYTATLYLRNLVATHLELGMIALLLGCMLSLLDLTGWAAVSIYAYGSEQAFEVLRAMPVWLPVSVLLIPLLFAVAVVLACAYWCIPWMATSAGEAPRRLRYVGAAIVVLGLLWWLRADYQAIDTPVGRRARSVAWNVAFALVWAWVISTPIAWLVLHRSRHADADAARQTLTSWLARLLRWTLWLILIGAVDRFAWFLAFEFKAGGRLASGALLALLAALGQAVLPALAPLLRRRGAARLLLPIGRLLGYGLSFLLCAWWVSLVHTIVLGALFQGDGPRYSQALLALCCVALPVLGYLLFTGPSLAFLNQSSLHGFYRARLVRGFLGAANPRRFAGEPLDVMPAVMPARATHVDVDQVAPQDDVAFADYRPQEQGGPVHLINVCVNQTRDPRGGLLNLDRLGLHLSLSSTGHLRVGQEPWQPLAVPDGLSLGTWTAISGAAVAPGLGGLTRGGISALATFTGIRLGYWWRRDPRESRGYFGRLLTKSCGLLRETFGVFEGGRGQDWFLSDGGHFENTGAYALLAERTPLIIVADCGADPGYDFADLENLVRKARIDLQTEIRFLRPRVGIGGDTIERRRPGHRLLRPAGLAGFGSLAEIAAPTHPACMALAQIDYGGARPGSGLMIVIKPKVAEGLPVDLVNFKLNQPDFPQESTADQSFSEAQWESYCALGKVLGERLDLPLLESLIDDAGVWFEADERASVDPADRRRGKAPGTGSGLAAGAELVPGRLSSRIAVATVGTTIGLGGAATVAVATWQAIDSLRSAAAREADEQRGALSELTRLWAQVPEAGARSVDARAGAVNALAAAIVRTADALCPRAEAGWFQTSALAARIHDGTLRECRALIGTSERAPAAYPACATLIEGADGLIENRLPNCLVRFEPAPGARPPPRYWVHDYSSQARYEAAHPCDREALERRRLSDRARSRDQAPVAAPDIELWPRRIECGAANPRGWLWATLDGRRTHAAAHQTASHPSAAGQSGSNQSGSIGEPAGLCKGRTVYVRIYTPGQRAGLDDWRRAGRDLGASIPPIEDVGAQAQAAGRVTARPVDVPTVYYHDPASRACAKALPRVPGQLDWSVLPLPARQRAIEGVIEVWLPPATSTRGVGATAASVPSAGAAPASGATP